MATLQQLLNMAITKMRANSTLPSGPPRQPGPGGPLPPGAMAMPPPGPGGMPMPMTPGMGPPTGPMPGGPRPAFPPHPMGMGPPAHPLLPHINTGAAPGAPPALRCCREAVPPPATPPAAPPATSPAPLTHPTRSRAGRVYSPIAQPHSATASNGSPGRQPKSPHPDSPHFQQQQHQLQQQPRQQSHLNPHPAPLAAPPLLKGPSQEREQPAAVKMEQVQ
jgi:hypothetical protein